MVIALKNYEKGHKLPEDPTKIRNIAISYWETHDAQVLHRHKPALKFSDEEIIQMIAALVSSI